MAQGTPAVYAATNAAAVTPSDSTDLTTPGRGVCFASIGALKVTMVNGDVVTFPSGTLAAGVIHPLQVQRVWATGTTATNIMVVW